KAGHQWSPNNPSARPSEQWPPSITHPKPNEQRPPNNAFARPSDLWSSNKPPVKTNQIWSPDNSLTKGMDTTNPNNNLSNIKTIKSSDGICGSLTKRLSPRCKLGMLGFAIGLLTVGIALAVVLVLWLRK
ncbi:unnamed protein product, partial [Adineta steineri]